MARRDDSDKLDGAKAKEEKARIDKLPKMSRGTAEKVTGRLDDETYVDRMMKKGDN